MQEQRTDFERLFEKCSTDRSYKERLANALEGPDDEPVVALLREIDVQGSGADWKERVSALRAARDPILDLAERFERIRIAG